MIHNQQFMILGDALKLENGILEVHSPVVVGHVNLDVGAVFRGTLSTQQFAHNLFTILDHFRLGEINVDTATPPIFGVCVTDSNLSRFVVSKLVLGCSDYARQIIHDKGVVRDWSGKCLLDNQSPHPKDCDNLATPRSAHSVPIKRVDVQNPTQLWPIIRTLCTKREASAW